MKPRFPIHGQTTVTIDGPIVRFYIKGQWNAEMVLHNHALLKAALAQSPREHWAMMAIPLDSAVCGPDAIAALQRCTQEEEVRYGRVATAWVLMPDVEGSAIMRWALNQVYDDPAKLHTFADEHQAEAWLQARMATFDPATVLAHPPQSA